MLDDEKLEEGQETETVSLEEFEKATQMVSQERANVQKMRTERDANAGQMSALTRQIEELRTQMDNKAADADIDTDDLDNSLADPAVVKSLKKQADVVKKLTETLGIMEHKVSKYEEAENTKRNKTAQDEAVNSILDMCDEEFDTNKYRNAALEMADKLVDSGEEQKPTSVLSGLRMMRKCYKKVEAEMKSADEDTQDVATDKGKGGFSFSEDDKYEEGSRDDVLQSMKDRVKQNK